MQRLKYSIKTLSPILFSKESGDRNLTETFDFIPGRVLQGIFAGKYIKSKNLGANAHNDGIFKDLFLNDKVFFSNAYIIGKSDEVFYPTPYSIQYEKENKENVYDLLLKQEDSEFLQTKHSGGYCFLEDSNVKNLTIEKSLNFHHGRDKDIGTSKKGIIFNYESIKKGQLFEGYISGNTDLLNFIIENFGKEFIAYTGRSKSSQYGKIKIELTSKPEDIEVKLEPNPVTSITFLSDVILINEYGKSECSIELFEKYLQEKISSEIKIKKSFVKPRRVDNYVSIWKLKKPSEICYSAGSCFLTEGMKDSDLEKLIELEINGIGERKSEGFGRIAFGIQRNEIIKNSISSPDKFYQPEIKIPEIAKSFVQNAIRDIFLREIKTKAIVDANSFNRDNTGKLTKSLIGRLESFIKGSSSIDDFKEKIKALRKNAKDKLLACKMENENLYDYLLSKIIDTTDVTNKSQMNSLNDNLIKDIYNASEDSDLRYMYKIYYLTFFAFLRKLIKKSQVTQTKENKNE